MLMRLPTASTNNIMSQVVGSGNCAAAGKEEAAGAGDNLRCGIRGCRICGTKLSRCSCNGYPKEFHYMCHKALIEQQHGLNVLPVAHASYTEEFHMKVEKTLLGYTTASGQRKGDNWKGRWDPDGKNEPTDLYTSMGFCSTWEVRSSKPCCGKGSQRNLSTRWICLSNMNS